MKWYVNTLEEIVIQVGKVLVGSSSRVACGALGAAATVVNKTGNFFYRYPVHNFIKEIKTVFVSRVKEGPLSVPSFTFIYNIWQDARIRTRVAATAARVWYTEHTSLKKKFKSNSYSSQN